MPLSRRCQPSPFRPKCQVCIVKPKFLLLEDHFESHIEIILIWSFFRSTSLATTEYPFTIPSPIVFLHRNQDRWLSVSKPPLKHSTPALSGVGSLSHHSKAAGTSCVINDDNSISLYLGSLHPQQLGSSLSSSYLYFNGRFSGRPRLFNVKHHPIRGDCSSPINVFVCYKDSSYYECNT